MHLKALRTITAALLGGSVSVSAQAADDIKYAAIQKTDDKWEVVSVTDTIPTYQEGMEILALPRFSPQYDSHFKEVKSQYGGIECPSVPDKTLYTPCNSYFFRMVGANWFGLGGIRIGFVPERLSEVKKAIIASNETVAAIKAKADEVVEARAQAAREAERLRNAKRQEEAKAAYEAAREAEIRASAEAKERLTSAPKGTKEFCGGTQLDGNPGDAKLAKILRFSCTRLGKQSYSDLVDAGWVIVNVMTHPINQFGQQALMYDVTMEKQ